MESPFGEKCKNVKLEEVGRVRNVSDKYWDGPGISDTVAYIYIFFSNDSDGSQGWSNIEGKLERGAKYIYILYTSIHPHH